MSQTVSATMRRSRTLYPSPSSYKRASPTYRRSPRSRWHQDSFLSWRASLSSESRSEVDDFVYGGRLRARLLKLGINDVDVDAGATYVAGQLPRIGIIFIGLEQLRAALAMRTRQSGIDFQRKLEGRGNRRIYVEYLPQLDHRASDYQDPRVDQRRLVIALITADSADEFEDYCQPLSAISPGADLRAAYELLRNGRGALTTSMLSNLEMIFFRDVSQQDMAKELGTSEENVSQIISRARKKITRVFKDTGVTI